MTINTDADVIRVIRENPRILIDALTAHPELVAEARRVVLSDELLAMPEQLAMVIKTQDETLKVQNETLKSLSETRESLAETRESLAETRETQSEMLKVQNEILKSLSETRESLAETRETQSEMLKVQNEILKSLSETRETQNKMLDEQANVRRDIGALHGMYRRQHEDFGIFRGHYAIESARRKYVDILMLFSKSKAHGYHRLDMREFTEAERGDFLDRNYDDIQALHLRERSWNTFLKGDIIARVTQRKGNGPGFYLAVEASYTADLEDLQRAIDHAKTLRCAGDLVAYAVVAGVRMHDSIQGRLYKDVEDFISARDENSALWFPLDLEDLRPDQPY